MSEENVDLRIEGDAYSSRPADYQARSEEKRPSSDRGLGHGSALDDRGYAAFVPRHGRDLLCD